jgi:hypothetical protein
MTIDRTNGWGGGYGYGRYPYGGGGGYGYVEERSSNYQPKIAGTDMVEER